MGQDPNEEDFIGNIKLSCIILVTISRWFKYYIGHLLQPGHRVKHVCTQEIKAYRIQSMRVFWTTWQIPGQPELHRETSSQSHKESKLGVWKGILMGEGVIFFFTSIIFLPQSSSYVEKCFAQGTIIIIPLLQPLRFFPQFQGFCINSASALSLSTCASSCLLSGEQER